VLFIRSDSVNSPYNLALEEYIMTEIAGEEPVVRLWQNRPSVIVGRYQNTVEEINVEYIERNGINVVRRLTGGGAVYHDLGNLNYTFAGKKDTTAIDFREFTEPIINLLKKLGIPAELSGRNDMTIEGRKFSGNAQFISKGKVLHHGTILYESRLEDVQAALAVRGDKIESKGIKSVRSRVCNLTEYMSEKLPLNTFSEMLLQELGRGHSLREYALTDQDRAAVRLLVERRYGTWEWNYGASPKFNQEKRRRFPWGDLVVRLQVEGGVIRECTVSGDFFSNADMDGLTRTISGARHCREDIAEALTLVNIEEYFPESSKNDFIDMII
jgi:lipoate-protein ligase A